MENIIKILEKYYPVYLEGLWNTVWISVVVVVLGTVIGIFIALAKMSKFKPLNWLVDAYIEIIRGTPALLQITLFWLFIPKLIPGTPDLISVMIALVVNAAAYIAEIIRAGIGAVDKGQWEAARSVGLSESHVFTHVVLPQAVKNILPALCNEFITTIKGTSLASTFFIGELMTSYKTVQSATFLAIPSLMISAMIYLVLNFTLSRLIKLLERRMTVSD